MRSMRWYADEARRIQTQRNNQVEAEATKLKNLITSRNLAPELVETILNAPIHELVNMLNAGQTTSSDIVLLFSHRAATIGLQYAMITEGNFTEAMQVAAQCDQARASSGKKNWTPDTPPGTECLPPFFGIPISIKDTIDMDGFASTIGCVARYAQKKKDGAILKVLRKSGMIPFVKSNVPQLAMTYESVNNLWGRALNPWNRERAVGGSSGGEGALVAARCSPIGVGSDIGGSIRIPCEFNGVYGLKPSSRRTSFSGHSYYSDSFNGQITIPAVMGPIGKSVEDLARYMKVLLDDSNYTVQSRDVYLKLHPFDQKVYRNPPARLRVGYFTNISFIPTSRASTRAVTETVEAMRQLGHEVIEIQLPDIQDVIGMFYEMVGAEGDLKGFREMLKGEDFIDEYSLLTKTSSLPGWINTGVTWLASKFKPRLGFLLSRSRAKSAYEYMVWTSRQRDAKEAFWSLWKSHNLDILVAPGFGSQAQKHGHSKEANLSAAYTFIWNVLELTAGAMPITQVREDEQVYQSNFNDPIHDRLVESAQNSVGLPVGIQVVGLPFEQQKVLSVMKIIETQFPFYRTRRYPI